MAKAIGPTFSGELKIYQPAITNWDFSWSEDGNFFYGPSYASDQANKTKIQAVYNAHDPVKSNLLDYSENARYNYEIKGITVNGVFTQTDLGSQAALHSVYTYCQLHPSSTIQWKLPDFTFTAYTPSQISHLFDMVNTFVQNCFNTEASVNSGIKAGTVTTNSQIDQAYATIPTNY